MEITAAMVLTVSAIVMVALWIAAFWFCRRRQAVGKTLAFYLGLFLVWPVSAISLWLVVTDSVLQGAEPVGPGVLYIFIGAVAVTLLVWLAGHGLASLAGWMSQKRDDAAVAIAAEGGA